MSLRRVAGQLRGLRPTLEAPQAATEATEATTQVVEQGSGEGRFASPRINRSTQGATASARLAEGALALGPYLASWQPSCQTSAGLCAGRSLRLLRRRFLAEGVEPRSVTTTPQRTDVHRLHLLRHPRRCRAYELSSIREDHGGLRQSEHPCVMQRKRPNCWAVTQLLHVGLPIRE